jgi:uncharacterized protein YgiM (DUF1202 family)
MAALALLAAFLVLPARAGETAVVQQNRINVRGRAALSSEVITQLKQGEKVEVLEEITLEKPKPDEPARWYRIVMPANTPVWVHADYLDTNKTVKVPKLNVRAGPGENYSTIGRLEKGATVKDIRVENGWMEIETPPHCFAFVAADYVTKEDAPANPGVVSAPEPKAEPLKPAEVKLADPAPAAKTDAPALKEEKLEPAAPPAVASTPEPVVKPAPAPASPPPAQDKLAAPAAPKVVPPPAVPAPEPAPAPVRVTPVVKPPPGPPPIRMVTREGVVSRNYSIQSPTHFGLEATDTGRTVNYLYGEKMGIKLNGYKGRKVIVTGEEAIDKRWPNVPVIVLDSIRLAPE